MREWIDLFESNEPKIHYTDEGYEFNGFGVHAVVDIHIPTGITIWELSSSDNGKGNATKALRWMKENYGLITVVDPGSPSGGESWTFWSKMADRGLVDMMLDRNDRPIYKEGAWLPHDDGIAISGD